MRTKFTKRGKGSLVPNLATCGGDNGPLFTVAQKIAQAEDDAFLDETVNLDERFAEVYGALFDLNLIAKERHNGMVTAEAVMEEFAGKRHYQKMSSQASVVAAEMSEDVKNVAHLMLPVKEGIYSNQGVVLPIRNYVELGPQIGNLVIHLGGCFSSRCSNSFIEQILYEQAQIPGFLKLVDSLREIDYADYPLLMKHIGQAKSKLGL